MSIWFKKPSLEELKIQGQGTLVEHMGIEFTEVGENFLKARMLVDERTKQPAGILHGGASAALAETVGSRAGNSVVDASKEYCVGLEINANHIRSVTEGFVEAVATPFHLGRGTQVWDIQIRQGEQLVCVSRLTLLVRQRR